MAILQRNDEQIKVGTTSGLVAGETSFLFDGTLGTPDYRGYQIVISEYQGRQPMIRGLDYSWNFVTGLFTLLQAGDIFANLQWYTVSFQTAYPPAATVVPGSIIDASYFIREINIPNILPSTNGKNASMIETLNSFIQKWEPKCLKLVLGYDLYQVVLSEESQRVTDLIYGKSYVDSLSNNRNWQGLVQPDIKESLITNYIYYYFKQSTATQTTGKNTVVPKGEASTEVSPKDKMIAAWNYFSSEVSDLQEFIVNSNATTPYIYPEYTVEQYCYVKRVTRRNNFLGI